MEFSPLPPSDKNFKNPVVEAEMIITKEIEQLEYDNKVRSAVPDIDASLAILDELII